MREPLLLGHPFLADELTGREAIGGLRTSSEVVSGEGSRKVLLELVVALVIEPPSGKYRLARIRALAESDARIYWIRQAEMCPQRPMWTQKRSGVTSGSRRR